MSDVEVLCDPSKLPEFIAVDMAQIDVGAAVHLSDLVLPEGVEIPELHLGAGHNQSVVQIIMPRSAADAE